MVSCRWTEGSGFYCTVGRFVYWWREAQVADGGLGIGDAKEFANVWAGLVVEAVDVAACCLDEDMIVSGWS